MGELSRFCPPVLIIRWPKKYHSNGPKVVLLTFGVQGRVFGRRKRVFDETKIILFKLANIGRSKSLIIHPAMYYHPNIG